MANAGAKLSSFPEVNDIQTGDMFPLLSGGDANAKIDYATLARAIIAKLKSEDVVQTQTNNANKLISAALAYSMNQDILQLEEDTSTEQEEKSVTAGIVTVEDADGGDAGLTLNLEPHQSGSGDPSPENIRPISGYDDVNVTRAGKNLLNPEEYGKSLPFTSNGVTFRKINDGVYHASGTAIKSVYYNITFATDASTAMPCDKFRGKRVFLSITGTDQIKIGCSYFRSDGTYAVIPNGSILPDDAMKFRLYLAVDSGKTVDTDFSVQFELGSIATDYEPYQGNQLSITFPPEAGTVYGGTLDVKSGELTVDCAEKTFNGTESWEKSSALTDRMLCGVAGIQYGDSSLLKACSHYEATSAISGKVRQYTAFSDPGGARIAINTRDYTEVADFKSYLAAQYSAGTPLQVVYPLATPLTYQLTPTEVTMLIGHNTIWMDADGTVKLDYKTNAIATKGDVNEAIARIKALAKITEAIAPVESSYKATQNYSVGDYLIVDYKLYKVTAAIANGGTVTPNTNVTATTIMAEIKALA